jgi:hypothetical protein
VNLRHLRLKDLIPALILNFVAFIAALCEQKGLEVMKEKKRRPGERDPGAAQRGAGFRFELERLFSPT